MAVDAVTVNALIGVVGIALGVLGKAYATRQDRGTKEDSALARVLERRDEDYRKLAEHTLQQVDELRSEMASVRSLNDDCERRYAKLTERVFRLERKTTPPGDTPTVGIMRPISHEEVGGHE